jgi:hypothetical protein
MIASLIILAAIGISGSCFIIGTLLTEDRAARRAIERHDAAHDLIDQLAHGDIPALPSASFPFHREGL